MSICIYFLHFVDKKNVSNYLLVQHKLFDFIFVYDFFYYYYYYYLASISHICNMYFFNFYDKLK